MLRQKKKQKLKPRQRLSERERTRSDDNGSAGFRRNQTLSSANRLKAPSVDNSPRMTTHTLDAKRRHVFGWLIVVLFVIVTTWLLVFNFTAQPVVEITNSDITRSVDQARYQEAIQSYLDVNPVDRLAILVDYTSLNNYMHDKLPEVLKITQDGTAGLGKTNFLITLRTPVAGWNINHKQYYVDSNGVQFEQNYFAEPGVQIVDESGISVTTSNTVAIASRRFLSFVGRVVSLSKGYGYTVTKAILPSNTTRQLEINLKEKPYLIKLSIDRPAGEQVEDMKNTISYFDKRGINPGYVDLRVSGRAFYK